MSCLGKPGLLDIDARGRPVRSAYVAVGTGVAHEWLGVRRDLRLRKQVEDMLGDGRIDIDQLGVRPCGEAGCGHVLS